jgi:hypothetical protein
MAAAEPRPEGGSPSEDGDVFASIEVEETTGQSEVKIVKIIYASKSINFT